MTFPVDLTHDLGHEFSRSTFELALSQEWEGQFTWEQKGCELIIHDHDLDLCVTIVAWVDVPDSDRVTSDVGGLSTHLVFLAVFISFIQLLAGLLKFTAASVYTF